MKRAKTTQSTKSKPLSRAQTAKIRKALTNAFNSIKEKQQQFQTTNSTYYQKPTHTRPVSTLSNFLSFQKVNQFDSFSSSKNNLNVISNSRIKSSYDKLKEFKKNKVTEICIQNLFTAKMRHKKNEEKKIDYSKNINYQKLVMRAKLLKAVKQNIVLRKNKYDEYKEKFSTGNKSLSNKIKYRRQKHKFFDNSFSKINEDDSDNKTKVEKPDFNSLKYPDLFSTYQVTTLFHDFHYTPMELIKKIFTKEERKIVDLDPVFFRLNKEPFTGVTKNLRFNLKDKLNEEDKIKKERKKTVKLRKEKMEYLRMKRKSIFFQDSNEILKRINYLNNEKNKNGFRNNFAHSNTQKKIVSCNNSNEHTQSKIIHRNFDFKKKKNKENNKNNLFLKSNNIKTKSAKLIEGKSNLVDDDEGIKKRNKKLSMEELFEMFNERKKIYLEDLSYNRIKNLYKFQMLRTQHNENLKNEADKTEKLRFLILQIEENYKKFQK